MTEIPISGFAGILSRLLDVFRQKAFVYVEVSFGLPKPYALTVINRSNFTVFIESLAVSPEGLPLEEGGWQLGESALFKNKALVPGQRIRFYFVPSDLGPNTERHFTVRYSTLVFGKRVPRAVQKATCDFAALSNTVRVQSTVKVSWSVAEEETQ